MTGDLSAQVAELVAAAERAQSAHQADEAARVLMRAQELAPEHPLVLNAAGRQMLLFGSAEAAEQLFRRAIAADATRAGFWVNLASALRRQEKFAAEAEALEQALRREPRHLLALLQKASLLERTSTRGAAARAYLYALQSIPASARLPAFLRPAIDHAVEFVKASDATVERLLADQLAELRGNHGTADLSRFDHAIAAFLGRQKIYTSQPTFLQIPRVAAEEFHGRDAFPWLTELEQATPLIRRELEQVLADDAPELAPYIQYSESLPVDQWKELNHSRRWSAYFLWKDGERVEPHLQRCPETAKLLECLPMIDIPQFAPAAFFSILEPRTRIPPHAGVTNARLIVHLPLVVPRGCGFRVGAQSREWIEGRAWVFDDTIEHEAWNDSDQPRAILIFDVWNPALTVCERDLLRRAFPLLRNYYAGDPALTA